MPVFTVEAENLLAVLPEGLDKKQTIFQLDRIFHQEEDEEIKSLIIQGKSKLENLYNIAFDESPYILVEYLA